MPAKSLIKKPLGEIYPSIEAFIKDFLPEAPKPRPQDKLSDFYAALDGHLQALASRFGFSKILPSPDLLAWGGELISQSGLKAQTDFVSQ